MPPKVQTHPISNGIGGSMRKNLEDTSKDFHVETRADMRILCGLLFMWGVVSSFLLAVSVLASQKTRFQHSKNRKCTFHGTK
jgi:hypothetical protein